MKTDNENNNDEIRTPQPQKFEPSDHSRFIPGGDQGIVHESEQNISSEIEITEERVVDIIPASDTEQTPVAAEENAPEEPEGIWARLAHYFSWAMVPMLMPVYGILLIFGLSILNYTGAGTRFWITAIIFGINVMLPILIILALKMRGVINDVGLNSRTERMIPYVVSILALGATAWFVASKHAPMWVTMFFVGGAAAGLVNFAINFRWKISAHAAGVAGIVALLIRIARDGFPQGDVMLWLLIAILAAGITGSARLYLHRHTFWQVMAGYATGFCGVYFMTMIQ